MIGLLSRVLLWSAGSNMIIKDLLPRVYCPSYKGYFTLV